MDNTKKNNPKFLYSLKDDSITRFLKAKIRVRFSIDIEYRLKLLLILKLNGL
jgi:hypothetical protein